MTDQEFALKIREFKEGYIIWQDIMERYELSDGDYVIAFPHEDDPVNKCGITHLKQYMKYGGEAKRILILCIGHKLPGMLSMEPDDTSIRIKVLESREMESLVTLYSLSTISSHFLMMSLTKPYGRYGDRILKKEITLDEIVTVGIYGMTEKEVFEKYDFKEERQQ